MLKEKGKQKEEMSWRGINIQHVILNDAAQLAKLCMSIVTKGGLSQKEHNLTDYQVASVTKHEPTAGFQYVFQMSERLTCPLYPKTDPKRKFAV